jgi:hypothetical protein
MKHQLSYVNVFGANCVQRQTQISVSWETSA